MQGTIGPSSCGSTYKFRIYLFFSTEVVDQWKESQQTNEVLKVNDLEEARDIHTAPDAPATVVMQ